MSADKKSTLLTMPGWLVQEEGTSVAGDAHILVFSFCQKWSITI
jgi:hypothetical protein